MKYCKSRKPLPKHHINEKIFVKDFFNDVLLRREFEREFSRQFTHKQIVGNEDKNYLLISDDYEPKYESELVNAAFELYVRGKMNNDNLLKKLLREIIKLVKYKIH